MKQAGYKNADSITPIRAKDKLKSEKKTGKAVTATPEFDKGGPKTPQGVSPIKKDLSQNKSGHLLGDDKARHATPTRVVPEKIYKAGIPDGKNHEKPPLLGPAKKVTSPSKNLEPEERLDSSFELEEKRIRRENLAKSLLATTARVVEQFEESSKRALVEYLRKNSRIFDVQMEYAVQQRNNALKGSLLRGLYLAAKKQNYHMRLVRNFARILNRPLKIQANHVLEYAFSHIKHLKVPLHRPLAKDRNPKPAKPIVNHTRSNTNSAIQDMPKISANSPEIFAPGDSQISTHTKKSETAKSPKPKIKIDESKTDRTNHTKVQPPKENPTRKPEVTRDQGKSKEPLKKSEAKTEVQPIKSKELPSKKAAGIVSIKPYSVNSSREELNISASKIRQSAASDLKESSVSKKPEVLVEIKKQEELPHNVEDSPSKLVPLVDNSNSIMTKHQELKNKLLRQIRGEVDDEEEEPAHYGVQYHTVTRETYADEAERLPSSSLP